MKKARRANPEVEMKARELINIGYQRLLTFEVEGGGFDWYGHAPANVILSAWGLLEFTDMAKVYDIDTRIIERTRQFLLSKQDSEGAWSEGHGAYSWNQVQGKVLQTAYVAWSMLESGFTGQQMDRAIQYISTNFDEKETNPYLIGLVALALSKYNAKSELLDRVLARLTDTAKTEKGATWWESGQTLYYGNGKAGAVEVTSLISMALMNSKKHPDYLAGSLRFITSSRDGSGSWGTTQATILALQTLNKAMSGSQIFEAMTIGVDFNGKTENVEIKPENAEVMRLLDFKGTTKVGENKLDISIPTATGLLYQVVARYYVPWKDVDVSEEQPPVEISVDYDRTKLAVEDTLTSKVKVKYNAKSPTFMMIVDLGIPAGFTLITDVFDKMLEEKRIDKYTTTGRQITLYIGKVTPGYSLDFSYQLIAKFPVKVKSPESKVYEYYNPENKKVMMPTELEIVEK